MFIVCGTLRVHEFEQLVYTAMVKKLREFQVLTARHPKKASPKLTQYQVQLATVEAEIEKLLDSLTGANAILVSYANSRVEELDAKRQELTKAISDLQTATLSPEHIKSISGYLERWEDVSFDDRRTVLDDLIVRISATSENVAIEWLV